MDPPPESGDCALDHDGEGGLPPFDDTCNMTDKNGVGVTVISHDSENRTLMDGCGQGECYSRDTDYAAATTTTTPQIYDLIG